MGELASATRIPVPDERAGSVPADAQRIMQLADGAEDFMLFRVWFRPVLRNEFVTSGVRAILGYTAAEMHRRPTLLFEVLHPDDVALVQQDMSSAEAASRPKTLRFVHADGRTVWVHARTSPILDPDGAVAGVEGICYDITARLQAENALRDSERRFRSLVQNASDLVCLVGPHGMVDYVSPSVTEILGHCPDSVVGLAARRLGHPEDMDALADAFATVGPAEQATVEFRVWHRDNGLRWLEGVLSNRLDDPAIGGFVLNMRDVTEQRRLADELARRANYDPLTGLPNKLYFREQVDGQLTTQPSRAVAVLSVRVDGLASIAEAFGYDHADDLLCQVARRLHGHLPAGALLSRAGDTAFAAAVPVAGDPDAAGVDAGDPGGPDAGSADGVTAGLARTLLDAFSTPFLVGGDPFQLDATVGAAVAGGHGRDAAVLLRRAERACRSAHGTHRGFRLYSADLDESIAERLSLLGQLRDAIGSNQLRLHYQPKLDLATGTVDSVEALIRWHHPGLGFVAPDRFIPLAEQSGLIAPLTRWVLDEAARQAREWLDQGIELAIAVNITPRSLQDPHFPDEVADVLLRRRLPGSALCLELTERAVTTDPETAGQTCRRLADEGIMLSLDDFGTGQSSLGYLAQLPISELKIDMSFIRPLTTSSQAEGIVRMIVDLAHQLRQTATAEGVEDQATVDVLHRLGCDTIQGYHLSRPLPAAELTGWLAGRPARPADLG